MRKRGAVSDFPSSSVFGRTARPQAAAPVLACAPFHQPRLQRRACKTLGSRQILRTVFTPGPGSCLLRQLVTRCPSPSNFFRSSSPLRHCTFQGLRFASRDRRCLVTLLIASANSDKFRCRPRSFFFFPHCMSITESRVSYAFRLFLHFSLPLALANRAKIASSAFVVGHSA